MIIGIDNVSTGYSTSRRTIGGMRHFLQDITTWMARVAPQHEYVLFQPQWADPLSIDMHPNVRVQECAGVPKQRIGRVIYEQSVYASIIDRSGIDVLLACNNILPLRLGTPSVVVVQSLQYFDFPQIYSWPQLVYLRNLVPRTLRKATRVIALSQTSKQTILEKVHVPSNRIHVVYHGLSSDVERNRKGEGYKAGCRLVQSLSDGKPYILSVSSFYWQKNLQRLIEAFSLLKRSHAIPHQLLVVGGNSSKITRRDLLLLASQAGVGNSVVCPGVVAHELVPAFYMLASVNVMPSLYETFGHPIIEAMSCGCPVVTSNTGTMAEVAQDCAVLVNPYNVESIAEGIARVLGDAGLRDMMVTRGRVRAQDFTLESQAYGYIQALEEAAHAWHARNG